MSNQNYNPVPKRLLASLSKNLQNDEDIRDLFNYLTFLQDSLTNYIPQTYAGSPESNVSANKSGLCVDTTNDFLYYNFTEGATTGWTKIVV